MAERSETYSTKKGQRPFLWKSLADSRPVLRELCNQRLIHVAEEQQRHREGGNLCDGIAPPDEVVVADARAVARENIGQRHEEDELADDGDNHRMRW